ncbi:MAG: peptidoglycan-binding protein [Streptosporangiaceae bacterium]
MSGTVTGSTETSQPQTAGRAAQRGPRRRRRRVAAGVSLAVALAAGGAAGAWHAGAFSSAALPEAGRQRATATRPVVREDIAATTPVAATLGYAGSYSVGGQGGGTLTWLPSAGQVVSQGQVLYQTGNGSPVVLLYGSVPAWRALAEGVTGADVSQLNHDLVALGYAGSADVAAAGWDYYSPATASGVQQLEEHLGVSGPAGSLSLGQVVFEPAAIRVTQVDGSLGGPASGPVLEATSDEHVVMIALDVSQESEVRAGDEVSITLPDGTTTPGVVSSAGTVATSTPASQQGQSPVATIPVTVRLSDPAAAGSLDQAPVTVNITTETARDALAVPVTALLAHPGGYVVEVAGPGGTRRYVPVTPGVFDDSSGLVQVTGALTPGQRVVVASS